MTDTARLFYAATWAAGRRLELEVELNRRRRLCYAGPMRPWCSRLRAVLGALAR